MLAGENLMNKRLNAPSAATKGEQDRASDSLAESSVNEAPASPGGLPARDEAHHKIPQTGTPPSPDARPKGTLH